MTIKTLVFSLLVLSYVNGLAGEVQPGAVTISPDGRFTIHFTEGEMNLKITDNQTEKVTILGVLTPCYSLKWTGDSRTIVAITHIAEGSNADIFHYNKGRWRHFFADPLDNALNHILVVDQEIGMRTVRLTYKADTENAQHDRYFTYAFTFNPETGATTRIVEREIDDATYYKVNK